MDYYREINIDTCRPQILYITLVYMLVMYINIKSKNDNSIQFQRSFWFLFQSWQEKCSNPCHTLYRANCWDGRLRFLRRKNRSTGMEYLQGTRAAGVPPEFCSAWSIGMCAAAAHHSLIFTDTSSLIRHNFSYSSPVLFPFLASLPLVVSVVFIFLLLWL